VQPKQSATEVLVAFDPENESGKSKPPVPTYAEIELLPPTFGLAATGGVPTKVAMQSAVTQTAANCNSLAFIWFPPKHMWPIEFAKILSLNRQPEFSSPDLLAVDN